MKRMMCFTTLFVASLLPAVAGAEEGNLNSSLRGLYSFTGDAVCITSQASPPGFSGFHALYPAYTFSQSVEGVRRFNGDGTGKIVSGRSISISHGSDSTGLGPVTMGTFTADFTYTVALDRSIHMDVGPLEGIQTVGPGAGTPHAREIWTGIRVDGHVSQDFKTITVATAKPEPLNPKLILESGHYPDAVGGNPHETRACHRSRVMVRIGDRRDRDD